MGGKVRVFDNGPGFPRDKTIHELFEDQASRTPDNTAVVSMVQGTQGMRGTRGPVSLTYGELNREANRVARVLGAAGVTCNTVVAIMVERSVELVIGVLGILKAGGAYMPVDPLYPEERIGYILRDSGAEFLLTTGLFLHKITGSKARLINLEDRAIYAGPHADSGPVSRAGDIAYIIYTSGSTGSPKGVAVEHRSAVNVLAALARDYPLSPAGGYLFKTSYLFDVSVSELFGWFWGGGRLVILEKEGEKDPGTIVDTIAAAGVTHINFVPAMFNVFTRHLDPAGIRKIRGLTYIFLAGEALVPESVDRFRRLNTGIRLENLYGPTEGTVYASRYSLEEWNGTGSIPIGKPMANVEIHILDKEGRPAAPGETGELCITGAGVARGYLNRPGLTAERFYRSYRTYYKTGDLARRLPDGNIEFLGRMDFQVKVRGFRVELGEIENRLLRHGAVKEAVVTAREDETGDKYLCAYIVPGGKEEDPVPALKEYLSQILPGYMVPSYFVILDRMPLTGSGKTDRNSLPAPETTNRAEYAAPRNEIEETLAELWSEALGIKKERIGIHDNFFERGGHSLKGTTLLTGIHKRFNVRLPLSGLFKMPVFSRLAEYIEEAAEDRYLPLERVEEKEYYALSSAQKRLYIMYRSAPDNTVYNIPLLFEWEGPPDVERLERAFKTMIARHESFRTSFTVVNNEPVQEIHDSVDFAFDRFGTGAPHREVRPFDLSLAPLLRAAMGETGSGKTLLLVDMHHIVSDGLSIDVFQRELEQVYDSVSLPPPRVRYRDYSEWKNREEQTGAFRRQREYWLNEYPGEVPVLMLPLDFPRPRHRGFGGETIYAPIDLPAREKGVTLYMFLSAAFYVLLTKLSGQEDIVAGTPVGGREHNELRDVVGMFVGTLALRRFPRGEWAFSQFLKDVRERTLAAFENQDYPFEELVKTVAAERDPGRNPLFDCVFALETFEPESRDDAVGLKLKPLRFTVDIAKFDLSFTVEERADGLTLRVEYCTALFKQETVGRFIRYFKTILAAVSADPGKKISDIDILSGEEKRQLLETFNDTSVAYPRDKTVPRLFEAQVRRTPDAVALHMAYRTYKSYKTYNTHLTYSELNRRADCLASLLWEKGARPDTITGIMVERSVEMFVGILGIFKTGSAYLPIAPDYPEERKRYMLADSGAGVLLTTRDISRIPAFEKEIIYLDGNLDDYKDRTGARRFSPVYLHPGGFAYIIYTSGSTGAPKGVLISHSNLSPLLFWGYDRLGIGAGDRTIQNLSYYFDWSVWEIFITFTSGAVLYTVPPEILSDPRECTALITKNGITVLHITPTQFQPLARFVVDSGRKMETLDYLFIGAERLVADLLELSFQSVTGTCRIFNMYGPTEATIISTTLEIDKSTFETCISPAGVSIGKPVANARMSVLDNDSSICPVRVAGELYIGGDGVAPGYLNNPELTREKFNRPYKSYRTYIFYKTGDRVRWLPDGTLEFLDRVDFQVKIRGFRIEIGEIENCLLKHPGIKEAVVIPVPGSSDGDKYLCAYFVSDGKSSVPGLREYLASELPGYMIPSFFVPLEKLPLTGTGKVDRKALPDPGPPGGTLYARPRDRVEEKLVAIWAGALGVGEATIGIDDDFFRLGGHSLNGAVVAQGIHRVFNIRLPLAELFETPSIRQLAVHIKDAAEERYLPLERVEKKEYYPLSTVQEQLYVLYRMAPGSMVYNIPVFFDLEEMPDTERLERAFKTLIARHESFRTSFRVVDNEPVQRIHDTVEFSLEIFDIGSPLRGVCPFDLSRAPLLRAAVGETEEGKPMLMMDMHHIVSDGVSVEIAAGELTRLYNGETLPPTGPRYRDYVQWENSAEREEREGPLTRARDFWLAKFSAGVPVLSFPLDYPRPRVQSFEGETFYEELETGEDRALHALAGAEGATLYMLLLAAFYVLLSKLSGEEDIVVGTPSVGRMHAELHDVVGMFVRTLALRNFPAGEKPFASFLKEVKKRTLKALENQDFPFEKLVEAVVAERDIGRNPLFDCMFALETVGAVIEGGPELKLKPRRYPNPTSKFDLTFTVEEHPDRLVLRVEYGTKLFKRETVERMTGYYQRILAAVRCVPSQRISDVEIISPRERRKVLEEFNATAAGFPRDRTIHRLFDEQVARIPDSVALNMSYRTNKSYKTCNTHLTYSELHRRSRILASLLAAKGLGPGIIAGILAERSVEMVVGVLAVLKAGGAYMPMDPEYPEERKRYILADSGAKMLLTTRDISEKTTIGKIGAPYRLPTSHNPGDLAYIIYTSGSTGVPKGVAVEHGPAVNLLYALSRAFPVLPGDGYLLKTSFLFDVSVTELFGWFMGGGRSVVLEKDGEKDPRAIVRTVERHGVTHINFVPSMFNVFVNHLGPGVVEKIAGLRYIFLAGEALQPEPVNRFRRFNTSIRLENLYGPTEGTVYASGYSLSPWDGSSDIPIGKPLPNVRLFILDREGRPKAIGETGELCIAGSGVARGYLNNPGLTAERFDKSYKTYVFYKTGDLARWLPDGNIQFLGRMDSQVKVRGFRIELGDVENQLLGHPHIDEAVVTVREEAGDEAGRKYLCAYIVSDMELSVSGLREYLSGKLPAYMIPEHFLFLERIPLTPGGKADRKRLPEPGRFRPKLDTGYTPPRTELEKIIGDAWKEVLGLETVGIHDKFFDLGGNSLKFIRVNDRLQEVVGPGKDLPVIAMFQYPTIHSLAQYLSGEEEAETKAGSRPVAGAIPGENPGIAVIGMAGRFPGAGNIHEFWENLKNGVESIAFFSEKELEADGVPPESLNDAGYVKARGYLEDARYFDAAFFNYTPREADTMDPQLRLYHQCTWAALEDAGYDPGKYGGHIGVYSGAYPNISWTSEMVGEARGLSDHYDAAILNSVSEFGTRISYKLGLRGPSFSVQTACSTSLTAVHLACRGLLNRECDMALAGGVALASARKSGYVYQEGMILSSDGHNRAFDADAGGTVPGDGVGMAVLKRLDEAAADGDHIYAVVKGTAVNNDGTRKVGYTAPSIEGQAEVIREALRNAGVGPESVTFVETHGTGTPIGDPIEIEALMQAFKAGARGYCGIGSVKSNVGHLDTAAGIAGFIKTVLALKHRLLPPSLHYRTPNPRIRFEDGPFYVNTGLIPLTGETHPLRAGVSSFGIGGTNVHAILEEAPAVPVAVRSSRGQVIVLLSARTEIALRESVSNLAAHFTRFPGLNLADAAYTLQTGRKAFKHRAVTVCSSAAEAAANLSGTGGDWLKTFSSPVENRPVVFMFPGQGSQYVDMGLGLYRTEPLFREELDRCFDLLAPLLDHDIKAVLYPPASGGGNRNAIDRTEFAQPLIFAFEYALARLLFAWGLTPSAMIGHSIGEYTAACLSGVLSLEDALALVALRGKLMQQMPAGAMLSVPLPEQEVAELLNPELSLAAVNGPADCVISGPQGAVDAFAALLKEKGHEGRPLHTSHAFHSAMMDPVLEEFREKVERISFNAPRIPYLSNVTGTWITGEEAADPGYWATHLRQTVRFFDGLRGLLEKEENAVLVEAGPGRVLSTFALRHPGKTPGQVTLNPVRHPKEAVADDRYLAEKVGMLWMYGAAVDWTVFYAGETRRRVPLPTYPFERHPYRLEGPVKSATSVESGAALRKKTDIADWFYTPSWKRVSLPRYGGQPARATWLVFALEQDFCRALVQRLENEGQEVIVVMPGTAFAGTGPREFVLDPRCSADYDVLFSELHGSLAAADLPLRILHLWQAGPEGGDPLDFHNVENILNTGFYSLLDIARVLGRLNLTDPPALDVVTAGMEEVTGGESLSPARAAVLGPVKTIPLEYPGFGCRCIDTGLPGGSEGETIDLLLAELSVPPDPASPPAVIAYRRGRRWVRDFEALRLPAHTGPHPYPARLREGGVYLVTGGLGGMGLELAGYIAGRVKAKLVLADLHGEKTHKIRELENKGADVWVAEADLTDIEQVRAVVEETGKRFGPINGVIHAAGVPDGRLIQTRTREFTEKVLAPKIKGTLVLDSLLNSGFRPDFVVLCSSVNAVIGETGQVAYTAANCFLDAYASYKTLSGGPFTAAINWDTWKDVGMARDALKKSLLGGDGSRAVTSRVSPKEWWVMGEHRVNGTPTLVGTAYLEMVYAASVDLFVGTGRDRVVEIRDLAYLAPLTAAEDEEIEVNTVLEEADPRWKFIVQGRGVHARGEVAVVEAGPPDTHSIAGIIENCALRPQSRREPGAQSRTISVGRRWDNLKEVRYGENCGLALLELPPEFSRDMDSFKLHPALLDRATAFLLDNVDSPLTYLPFSYKRVRIRGSLPPKVYSYARLAAGEAPRKQALEFDITVLDETGVELIDIEGLTMLAVSDVTPSPPGPVEEDPLKEGILSAEGVEVFARVLSDVQPRVVVSTVDFPLRLEREKDCYGAALPVPPGEGAVVLPGHARPGLSTPYTAPETPVQEALAAIWGEYLGIREIGIHDDFFELGADSLKALTVIARIHEKLNARVSVTDIFTASTVARLAELIRGAEKSIYTFITPVEEKEYYPMSSAQTRLFLLQRAHPESVFYNLPILFTMKGRPDMGRLQGAFRALIRRHESLRTSFALIDGEPVQKIHNDVEFNILYHEVDVGAVVRREDIVENFVRPFDLARAPLVRLEIVKTGRETYLWLFDVHHIVTDATGYAVLQKDLVRLYARRELPPVKVRYKDFSTWQNRLIRGGEIAVQEKYWTAVFADAAEMPRPELPTDFPRPQRPRFEGNRFYFELGAEEGREFKNLVSRAGTTLFTGLLAVLNVLLFKYSGGEDVVIGSSIAGRPHADLEGIVGMFVNMLAIRNFPKRGKTFREFLQEVKTAALGAFENQDVQFEILVERLNLETGSPRNPLFDVCLNVENYEQPVFDLEGVTMTPYTYEPNTSKFDMLVWATPVGETLRFMLEYSTELLKPAAAKGFADHMVEIIEAVVKNPETRLADIAISVGVTMPRSEAPEIEFDF